MITDDDATGTQTVSGVDVILAPEAHAYERFFASSASSTYVLSNTSARDEAAAIRHVREIECGMRAAGAQIARAGKRLASGLERQGFAIVSTGRTRAHDAGDSALGKRVMAMLLECVAGVGAMCDGLIAKGGINSARVVRHATGATVAWVGGQVAPGVALRKLPLAPGRRMPLAVVPGNVGGPRLRADVARQFGVGR